MTLVYCTYPTTTSEPYWLALLARELRDVPGLVLYRPWLSLSEQLVNPDLFDHLNRPPRPAFLQNRQALKLDDWLFGGIDLADLSGAMGPENPTIQKAERDLFVLMHSDILLVDLTTPSMGEQGIDVFLGHVGGLSSIGITDQYQIPPSILARLNVVCAPTSPAAVAALIRLFSGVRDANAPAPPVQTIIEDNEDNVVHDDGGARLSSISKQVLQVVKEAKNHGNTEGPVPRK